MSPTVSKLPLETAPADPTTIAEPTTVGVLPLAAVPVGLAALTILPVKGAR